jgi:hypothetical protein
VKKHGADNICFQNWDYVQQKIVAESETVFFDSPYTNGVDSGTGGAYGVDEPSIS